MLKTDKGRVKQDFVDSLKDSALRWFGIKFSTKVFDFEIKQLIHLIIFFEEQMSNLNL